VVRVQVAARGPEDPLDTMLIRASTGYKSLSLQWSTNHEPWNMADYTRFWFVHKGQARKTSIDPFYRGEKREVGKRYKGSVHKIQ